MLEVCPGWDGLAFLPLVARAPDPAGAHRGHTIGGCGPNLNRFSRTSRVTVLPPPPKRRYVSGSSDPYGAFRPNSRVSVTVVAHRNQRAAAARRDVKGRVHGWPVGLE
ncbi:MAG: hypothetical protein M3P18_01520, partial [Actinomycetota bacterium]|nr:hypothetical protein [Actinomycetota bacterium]